MTEKILFVDDEPNILDAIRRQLRKQFTIATATSGDAGLKMLEQEGPFAVVVSDMQMPGMLGAEFLARVRAQSPDTVRMLLTGQAELDSAIAAVNEGNILRFLTKPCPTDVLVKAVQAGLEQYHLIFAERDLLEKTLSNSIAVLTEILGLVNPEAFSGATRIQHYVESITETLGVQHLWQLRVAAMLSQIGCVSLPPEVLNKAYSGQELSEEEQEMFDTHPELAAKLLSKIPRLEIVAGIISSQTQDTETANLSENPVEWEPEVLGGQILKVAVEFDRLSLRGTPRSQVLQNIQQNHKTVPRFVIEALNKVQVAKDEMQASAIKMSELRTRMVLDEDVLAQSGLLLVGKGQVVTQAILARLRNFARGVGIVEPFRVLVPR